MDYDEIMKQAKAAAGTTEDAPKEHAEPVYSQGDEGNEHDEFESFEDEDTDPVDPATLAAASAPPEALDATLLPFNLEVAHAMLTEAGGVLKLGMWTFPDGRSCAESFVKRFAELPAPTVDDFARIMKRFSKIR